MNPKKITLMDLEDYHPDFALQQGSTGVQLSGKGHIVIQELHQLFPPHIRLRLEASRVPIFETDEIVCGDQKIRIGDMHEELLQKIEWKCVHMVESFITPSATPLQCSEISMKSFVRESNFQPFSQGGYFIGTYGFVGKEHVLDTHEARIIVSPEGVLNLEAKGNAVTLSMLLAQGWLKVKVMLPNARHLYGKEVSMCVDYISAHSPQYPIAKMGDMVELTCVRQYA